MRKLESMLEILGKIASENSLSIFLDFGTLLGYIRCNGYVSVKDDDIDLSIIVDNDVTIRSVSPFVNSVCALGYISVPVNYAGKLQIIKFFPLERDLPTIDLHFYRRVNNFHTFIFANTVFPLANLDNLISRILLKLYYCFSAININGHKIVSQYPINSFLVKKLFKYKSVVVESPYLDSFNKHISGLLIPADYDGFLSSRYGNWRLPNHNYNYWTDQLDLHDLDFLDRFQ